METKGDLRDFECGVAVCVGQTAVSLSETADLLGLSHKTSPEFTGNRPKNRSYPVSTGSGRCSGGKAGHLLIGWLAVQSLAAPVSMPNILGQDTNPKLLSIRIMNVCECSIQST